MGERDDSGDILQARLDRLVAVFDLAFDELHRVVSLQAELTAQRAAADIDTTAVAPEQPLDVPLPYPGAPAPVSHLSRGLGSLVVAEGDPGAANGHGHN